MFKEAKTVHPYELQARSAKGLLQRLYRDLSTLIAQEVDLAKAEGSERGSEAIVAARSFALSGACGLLALACFAACAIAALSIAIGLWGAALVMAAAFAAAAALFRASALRGFARVTAPAMSKLNALIAPAAFEGTLAERRSRVEWTRQQVDLTIAALERKTDLIVPMRDTAFGMGSIGVALSAIARSAGPTQEP
jgi:hypothetical protein